MGPWVCPVPLSFNAFSCLCFQGSGAVTSRLVPALGWLEQVGSDLDGSRWKGWRAVGSSLIGLHLKSVLSQVSGLWRLGTGQPWEGQSLQGQQDPEISKHQKYRTQEWLVRPHLEPRKEALVPGEADDPCLRLCLSSVVTGFLLALPWTSASGFTNIIHF